MGGGVNAEDMKNIIFAEKRNVELGFSCGISWSVSGECQVSTARYAFVAVNLFHIPPTSSNNITVYYSVTKLRL
jgi:hypothetical protein